MQTDYDDYDDNENPGMRWMSIVVLLLAVAGFFSLAWYAYYTGTKSVQTGDIVVIEADGRPLKEAPKDPGGMEFPHKEKTIYDAVNPDAKAADETVVIEDEEEVVLPENMPASEPADEKIAAILQNAANETQQQKVTTKAEPAKEEAKKQPDPFEPVAKTEAPKAEEIKTEPVKAPEIKPSPVVSKEPIAPPPVATGNYKVQLGAFRSEAEALATWNKVKPKHTVLSGKSHDIQRADLGAKGIYYRLRVGGYPSMEAAKAACASLSSANQGCFPAGK